MGRQRTTSPSRALPAIALALSLAPFACDRKPSSPLDPDQQAEQSQSPATRSAQGPNAIEFHDPLAPIRKRAESGEVQAMITLGRAYESLGGDANRAQAREWYQKAANTGDDDAALSLKMLDATAQQPTDATASTGGGSASPAPPPGPPSPGPPSPGSRSPGSPLVAGGAAAAPRTGTTAPASPVTTAPAAGAPRDLTKVSWDELIASLDTTNFVTVARPDYRKRPEDKPLFVAISTAPDKTMTIAATGPTGADLAEVSIVMRVRNQQDVAANTRVAQASSITSTVTRNQSAHLELPDWIRTYLSSGVKSEPVFRNGWRIVVTGPAGEGVNDRKAFLGQAVLIEMKK